MLIVNDTIFAHGGVLMGHVQYGLDRINAEVSAWMRGDRLRDGSRAPPPFLAMGCVVLPPLLHANLLLRTGLRYNIDFGVTRLVIPCRLQFTFSS